MTLPNGVSAAYNYDAAGRLTEMKYSKGSTVLRDLVYGYDEINRRTSYSGDTAPEPQETATTNATVDSTNRYTSLNGKAISHDPNGNQTINNPVWDARDRLVSLSGPGFTASFTYDVMGHRTSKTVNGQTKTYLYDGDDLISETGAEYTFGPGIDEPLERKAGQNKGPGAFLRRATQRSRTFFKLPDPYFIETLYDPLNGLTVPAPATFGQVSLRIEPDSNLLERLARLVMLADKVDDLRLWLIGVELPLKAVLSKGRSAKSKPPGGCLRSAPPLRAFLDYIAF